MTDALQPESGARGGPVEKSRRLRLDPTTALLLLGAVLGAILLFRRDGADAVGAVLWSDAILIAHILPMVLGALLLGSFLKLLLPARLLERWLGRESGWAGLGLAALAGVLTPGGPFASFPLAIAFYRAGADAGVVIAYLTSWTCLNLARFLVFEIPMLGWELALLRLLASLPLPFLAGLSARWLIGRWPGLAPVEGADGRLR